MRADSLSHRRIEKGGTRFQDGFALSLMFALFVWVALSPSGAMAQGSVITGLFDSVAEGSISQRLVVAIKEAMTIALLTELLERMYNLFSSLIAACCLLAIIISGWRIVTGEMHDPRVELTLTAVKVGCVAYFGKELSTIMPQLLTITEELVAIVTDIFPDSLFVQGCQIALYNGDEAYRIWRDLDCLLVNFLSFSAIGMGSSALVGFLVSNFLSGYVGIHIAVLGIAALSGMIFSILRATYIYVSSLISITFMLSFAPLFLPCLLFQKTRQYFDKWAGLCLGYILQPMLVTAYLVIMLSLYQKVMFTNENSVAAVLLGKPVTTPIEFEEFFDIMGGTEGQPGVIDDAIIFSGGAQIQSQRTLGSVSAASPQDQTAFKVSGWRDISLTHCEPEAESDRSQRCKDPYWSLIGSWINTTADTINYCEYLRKINPGAAPCGTEDSDTEVTDKMREVLMSLAVFMLVVFANFTLLQVLEQVVKKLAGISSRVSIPFSMTVEQSFNRALYGADYYAFAGRSGGRSFLTDATRYSSWAPGIVDNPEYGAIPAYRAGLDGFVQRLELPFGIGTGATSWISKAEMGDTAQMVEQALSSGSQADLTEALGAVREVLSRSPTNREALIAERALKNKLGIP